MEPNDQNLRASSRLQGNLPEQWASVSQNLESMLVSTKEGIRRTEDQREILVAVHERIQGLDPLVAKQKETFTAVLARQSDTRKNLTREVGASVRMMRGHTWAHQRSRLALLGLGMLRWSVTLLKVLIPIAVLLWLLSMVFNWTGS